MINNLKRFSLILTVLVLGACTAFGQQKTWLKNFKLGSIGYKLYSMNATSANAVNDTAYYVLYRTGNVKPIARELKEIKNKKTGKVLFTSDYKITDHAISFSTAGDSLYNKYKIFTQNANAKFVVSKHQEKKSIPDKAHTMAEVKSNSGDDLTKVDVPPQFRGGINMMRRFVAENVVFPEDAMDRGVNGSVYASFVIERDGSVTDIKIVKGLGYGCDEEVIRVLKKMPTWKAAEKNGEKVRMRMQIPVSFRSED